MKIILFYFLLALVVASSPSGGYAPGLVQCPSGNHSFSREGDSISEQEKEWISERQKQSNLALIEFLSGSNLTGFNARRFISDNTSINVGLAFSGGGYRAMLSGAGQMAALDNRTTFKDGQTGLGGVLQSANYISALSGGSWVLGSAVMNDWESIEDIVLDGSQDLWNLTASRQLVNQSMSTFSLLSNAVFYNLKGALSHLNNWGNANSGIGYDLALKVKAGFNTSVTDAWGRGLAYQLQTNKTGYGVAATWSDVRNISSFKNHLMPFPILIALGRRPGTVTYNINSTVIEFNPFEMGSFDPSLNTFTDLKYIGSEVEDGVPVGKDKCVAGFDNAGFVMGTSSSLFNQFLSTWVCDDCTTFNWLLKPIVKSVLTRLSKTYQDVALYKPNPFYKSSYANSSNIATSDTLYLIDGGLGGEVIPLSSIMAKERALDIAFAFDNSNDSPENWPDGSALISTYERQFSPQGRSTVCPYVPDNVTFLAHNLTARPTFFGCDASNLTALVKDGVTPPIVVYFANRPFDYYANVSTFKLTYTDKEKKSMVQNGIDVVTRNNGTIDPDFRSCIACAIIRREEERKGIQQTDQCKQCFTNYCWDGKLATSSLPYYNNVNFTNNSLTNSSMALPAPVKVSGGLFGLRKR
jgi:lysophospholipase